MKRRLLILIFVLASNVLLGCGLQPVRFDGSSMKPTLNDGDKILFKQNWKELKRGDIITFLYPKDKTKSYAKRIIGLPGETVEIRNGKVYVNGEVLDEPYVNQMYNQSNQDFPPHKIPEQQYFVLGDNRDNSSDSRAWGTIDQSLITGKYYKTYSTAN